MCAIWTIHAVAIVVNQVCLPWLNKSFSYFTKWKNLFIIFLMLKYRPLHHLQQHHSNAHVFTVDRIAKFVKKNKFSFQNAKNHQKYKLFHNKDTNPCANNPCGSNSVCAPDFSCCGFSCTPSKLEYSMFIFH